MSFFEETESTNKAVIKEEKEERIERRKTKKIK